MRARLNETTGQRRRLEAFVFAFVVYFVLCRIRWVAWGSDADVFCVARSSPPPLFKIFKMEMAKKMLEFLIREKCPSTMNATQKRTKFFYFDRNFHKQQSSFFERHLHYNRVASSQLASSGESLYDVPSLAHAHTRHCSLFNRS